MFTNQGAASAYSPFNQIWLHPAGKDRRRRKKERELELKLKIVLGMILCAVCVAHGLCVGVVSPKVQGHGTDDPQLRGHLLHPPQSPLLLRIGKLDHQAGRGALRGSHKKKTQTHPVRIKQRLLTSCDHLIIIKGDRHWRLVL